MQVLIPNNAWQQEHRPYLNHDQFQTPERKEPIKKVSQSLNITKSYKQLEVVPAKLSVSCDLLCYLVTFFFLF